MKDLIRQLVKLKSRFRLSDETIGDRSGIAPNEVSAILDGRTGSLDVADLAALADAVNGELMIIPQDKAAEVNAILTGSHRFALIEQNPSALDRALAKARW